MKKEKISDLAIKFGISDSEMIRLVSQIEPNRNLTSQSVVEPKTLETLVEKGVLVNKIHKHESMTSPNKYAYREIGKEFDYYGFAAGYDLSTQKFSIFDLSKIASRDDLELRAIEKLSNLKQFDVLHALLTNKHIKFLQKWEAFEKYKVKLIDDSELARGRTLSSLLLDEARRSGRRVDEAFAFWESVKRKHNEYVAGFFDHQHKSGIINLFDTPANHAIMQVMRREQLSVNKTGNNDILFVILNLARCFFNLGAETLVINSENRTKNVGIFAKFVTLEISQFHRNLKIGDIESYPLATFVRMLQLKILGINAKDREHIVSLAREIGQACRKSTMPQVASTNKQVVRPSSNNNLKRSRELIIERLARPWGCDINSFRNIQITELSEKLASTPEALTDLSVRSAVYKEILMQYLSENYEFEFFDDRISSRPLLKKEFVESPNTSFVFWIKRYGTPFLLSSSQDLPEKYRGTYETFQEFTQRLSYRYLYLRKNFGLRTNLPDGKSISAIVNFVKMPNLQGETNGKFLLSINASYTEWTHVARFMEFESLDSFIQRFHKKSRQNPFVPREVFVRTCEDEDEVLIVIATLFLEVISQYMGFYDFDVELVEEKWPTGEERKRREFLQYLDEKDLVSRKIRERKNDIHCVECGRDLTDELSRVRLFGPICWEKLHPRIRRGYKVNTIAIAESWIQREAMLEFEDWLTWVSRPTG